MIKRFHACEGGKSMLEYALGKYVTFDDHAAALAAKDEQIERLLAANKDCIAWFEDARAECERLRVDAERYRWLRDVTDERPVNEKAYFSELAPDKRLLFNFPKLQAYNCIGQQFTLDEAVDAAIAAGREST